MIGRAIQDSGIVDALLPRARIEHEQAVAQAIGPTGDLLPRAVRQVRTPLVLAWAPGDTHRQRVARPGVLATLAAHCATPPSSGTAVVTVTQVTATAGASTIAILSIPQGEAIAEAGLDVAVPAGAWIGATLTTAAGASGVSTSLTVEVR